MQHPGQSARAGVALRLTLSLRLGQHCRETPDGCGEVLCQTNLNALGELEMCYDVYISRQSPFFSVTQSYNSQNSWPAGAQAKLHYSSDRSKTKRNCSDSRAAPKRHSGYGFNYKCAKRSGNLKSGRYT